MTNIEKYNAAFCSAFEIADATTLKGLKYQQIPLWDSVGHMTLVANLEDSFDIMMETDDIIDLNSYEKGLEILKNKYAVEF